MLWIFLNQLARALIIDIEWIPRRRAILNIVVHGAKPSEPILCRALRDRALSEPAVAAAGQFSSFQSTFEIVKHKSPNVVFREVQRY